MTKNSDGTGGIKVNAGNFIKLMPILDVQHIGLALIGATGTMPNPAGGEAISYTIPGLICF